MFCIGGSNYVRNPCDNIQIVHMQYTSSKVRESCKVLHNFHHSFYRYFVNIEEYLENVNGCLVLLISSLKCPIFLRTVCNLFHFLDYPYNIFHSAGISFGLWKLMARHFKASWGRKELYTSKESPITCCLKAILKLEESLSWKAPDQF